MNRLLAWNGAMLVTALALGSSVVHAQRHRRHHHDRHPAPAPLIPTNPFGATQTATNPPAPPSGAATTATTRSNEGAQDAVPTHAVQVRVVEVAGHRAFITPGDQAGVRRGALVSFGHSRLRVLVSERDGAVVELGDATVQEGDRGTAEAIDTNGSAATEHLATPPPLDSFRGVWVAPSMPAEEQHPTPVPLGSVRAVRSSELILSATAAVVAPTGGASAYTRGELRAQVRAEPFSGLPLSLDADAAVQYWLGSGFSQRPGDASRPLLRVRALELLYGDRGGMYASLGRMRYAATNVGMLDGVRLQSPSFSGVTIAAFGGFVPDPLSGTPAFDASRFGIEAAFRRPQDPLRPMLSLVGRGSLFGGSLDERRLGGSFRIYPGHSSLGGDFEVSFFDKNNPWNAPTAELTSAGFDSSYEVGPFRASVRLDVRRPERSRWLASFFPQGWLCIASQTPDPTTCTRADTRYAAVANAGVRFTHFAITGGATAIATGALGDRGQLGGYVSARVLRILEMLRVELSFAASQGTLLTSYSGMIGAGIELLDGHLDVSIRYRPAVMRYSADVSNLAEHAFGATALYYPTDLLGLTLDVEALAGGDVGVFIAQAGAIWRPEL